MIESQNKEENNINEDNIYSTTTPTLEDLINNPELKKILIREIYNESYYEFYKDAYKALLPNEPYDDNWHIEFLCDVLQNIQERISNGIPREKDLIINVPFRSSKSLIVTVIWTVWCWIKDQSFGFITVSFSGSLAGEHSQLSRDLINSEFFQDLYEKIIIFREEINAKTNYKIKGGGSRRAVGTGGQITGSGATVIILDDPQDPKKAASAVERKNTIEFYKNTLYSRLNQPELGQRIIVQQRLHEEDLTGYLIANHPDEYFHICIPAEYDNNLNPPELKKYYDKDGLFWSKRFSKKVIEGYTKAIGSIQAAGQLQQRPAPKEGNLVKRGWFEIIDPSTINRDYINEPMMFYLDTAESDEQKENGDNTAMCIAFKRGGIVYIANIIELKEEFYQLVKKIPPIVQNNMYTDNSLIKVEPKSSGKSVVSQLKNETKLNICELSSPTDDKTTRLSVISPKLETGRVKLLRGSYVEKFLDNICAFPNVKHDDDVDAFIHCITDMLIDESFGAMWI